MKIDLEKIKVLKLGKDDIIVVEGSAMTDEMAEELATVLKHPVIRVPNINKIKILSLE